MPGDRSGKHGNRGDRIDRRIASDDLQRELRALYELYRRGEIPERVVRLVDQLEEAYWDARFTETGNDSPTPPPHDKPN